MDQPEGAETALGSTQPADSGSRTRCRLAALRALTTLVLSNAEVVADQQFAAEAGRLVLALP